MGDETPWSLRRERARPRDSGAERPQGVNSAPIEDNQKSNNSSVEQIVTTNTPGIINVTKKGSKQRPKANSRICDDFEVMDCGFLQDK